MRKRGAAAEIVVICPFASRLKMDQPPERAQCLLRHADDGEVARAILLRPEESRDAERELYQRFASRIRLYGIRHLKSEDDALDLVHDVLIIAIRKLREGQVDKPERIGSFILGVARRVVLQQYRRMSRESLPGDTALEDVQSIAHKKKHIASEVLKKCLEALAERERSVLLLTYFAEQSTKAISESFGIQPGNVRVIRHRGMHNLRGCVGADAEMTL